MKKLFLIFAVILCLFAMSAASISSDESAAELVQAEIEAAGACPDEDYMSLMITACVSGDAEAGAEAQRLRDEKISEQGLDYISVDFEELRLLSKIIYAEAGSSWLSDEWKMSVGEVVLNRVSSPEFPDTVAEVIYQPGQYYGSGSRYFAKLLPDERCAKLALRLLEGERVLCDASVVFQANFKQGSGVHTALWDKYLGWTYFCYSSRTELY